ncbi:subtilisin-like protease SBT6.1 isoform X2 [Manihot esculenta]|uniref:subtilisin-like protease SBT6.1 isoform X2 n=1 Tax=Manihot esculenta TaxID=3983 RepID=UPI001CC5983A|nr:subtilisin-like protease SBT6.1 isoform X2 [Manihot esculenta]
MAALHQTSTIFTFKSALFISLISLYLIHFLTPSQKTLTLSPHNATPNKTQSTANYIVRFTEYRRAEHLRQYLESKVKSGGWEWIERRNPAMKYATDFGLVAMEESQRERLIGEIAKLAMVKDVNLDLSYKRDLLASNGGGAFVDGKKRPGKIFTSMSFSEGEHYAMASTSNSTINWGRRLLMQKSQVTSLFGADVLWAKGYTGAKVRMAIFDTGIRSDHPHFRNIKERTNWTNENTLNDNLGHGTFVAGVIAGQDAECLGFAPDTEIYAFRVFTDAQVSYTSWFLDAFNYAIATNMDVLNLSIGGPDYLDLPFVEKVWEITSNNIIMVSAIGNDGPLYGTLNNPADQSDVIGVGGIDYSDHMAPFSSRGMSTWEIPHGLESYEILKSYQPRASIFPSVLDFTDCPYSWPFCRQPLYAGAMPVMFNATILNGMGVIGYVKGPPTWHPLDEEGNLLSIHFTYSEVIWPWTGYLALHMQIKEEGAQFSGEIEGNVSVTIFSPPALGEKGPRSSTCVLQLKLKVVPTPARSKRVLWDQFHSIKYPPGYIPRDSLDVRNDILDWHGDHLHTNFHIMFNMLRDAGYYVETLGSPFTCFDARQYGTLLLVDLEDEFFPEEIEKLRDDVISTGLGLAVFAEWYNVDTMVKMRFFDDNTRSWWTPVTGGANIPALNDLLAPFGIAFGDKILNGDFSIDGEQSRYASGTDIVRFPRDGYVHSFPFLDSSESGATQSVLLTSGMTKADSPILGLVEVGEGRIAVYGDSNCLDSSHMVTNCYWLLKKVLDFTSGNIRDPLLFLDSAKQKAALYIDDKQLPSRRTDVNFSLYSAVVRKDLICRSDSRFEVWGTKGYNLHVRGRNRRLPGYSVIDLGRGLNSTADISRLRRPRITEKSKGDSLGNGYWGMLYGDELDVPVLVASHWLVPAAVAVTGVLLFLSIWRIRQKRRPRRRGSGSGRLGNL